MAPDGASTPPGLPETAPLDPPEEGRLHPYRRPVDAATLILIRRRNTGSGSDSPIGSTDVLLGCRAGSHAFMPNRYVFPGGRVDPCDGRVPVATPLPDAVAERLARSCSPARARALAVAAIRETYEETGLIIGQPMQDAPPRRIPEGWHGFLDRGLAPALDGLDYIARAVTPPGRARRFNARFFLAEETIIRGGRIKGNGELGDIRWIGLDKAIDLPLPTITRRILLEVRLRLERPRSRSGNPAGTRESPPRVTIPVFKTVRGLHTRLEE